MAAAAAGGSLESTLDRRLQAVSNTMDSIQGLSMWCIENKKYHSAVVRCWMKWLRKSDASHRLNLFYVANDIIQNCKRKGAVVYRTAFAEVLPDAFLLISNDSNAKVLKSVERILSIWEDRNVYTDNLISELRGYLVKEESPPAPATPVEQKTPVDSNAALKSKVLAEFVPQALVEQLSKYKSSLDDVELREKQLAAMRVDVCSTSALRKLKDKAGGKRFSKDFEDGSAKLQDFVKFLDQQSQGGPPLLEALTNADIFYEMQYQEVKIVANAYQTFANRVSHLKRKLDILKNELPDMDESPIPSPSADAPSPTGSESPFRSLVTSNPDPDLDGSAMDDSAMDDEAEPPAPSPLSTPGGSPKNTFTVGESDNIEVEDMELSEDEMESGGIIVEEQPVKSPSSEAVSNPPPVVPADTTRPSLAPEAPPPVTNATTSSSFPAAVTAAAPGLTSIDLNKMNSLISSLTSALKNTGASVETPPPPGPGSSSLSAQTTKPLPPASGLPKDARSLVSMLSKVDMTPGDLLSALAKAHGQGGGVQGLTSFLTNSVATASSDSSSTGKPPPSLSSTPASTVSNRGLSLPSTTPVPSPPVSAARHSPPRATLQDAAPQIPSPQVPAHQASAQPAPAPFAHAPPARQPAVPHVPAPQVPVHQAAPLLTSGAASALPPHAPTPLVPAPQQAPAHQAPVPHAPVHQAPAPRVPAPRVPASQTPAPQAASLLTSSAASALVSALHRDMDLLAEPEPEPSPPSQSLDSKIHSFLHGNPGFSFSLGFATDDPVLGGSPVIGTDTRDGTPVRDEGGGTPTQDEIMDKPVVDALESSTKQPSAVDTAAKTTDSKLSPPIYQASAWQDSANPQKHVHSQPGAAQNGQGYQPYPYGSQVAVEHGTAAPVECYQQIAGQGTGPTPGEQAPLNREVGTGWYGYPDGSVLPPSGSSVATPGGSQEHQAPHPYPYQADQTLEPQGSASQQGAVPSSGLFKGALPPVPTLPPPPDGLKPALPAVPGGEMVPPQGQKLPNPEITGDTGVRTDSVIGRMVVHDHQHKSVYHTDNPPYRVDDVHRFPDGNHLRPDGIHGHPDDIRRLPDGLHRHPDDILRHPDGILRHPDDILRHPDGIHGHPDDIRRLPDGLHRHPDDILRPPDGILRPPDGILRPPDGILRPPDGILRHPDDILRPPDGILRHPDEILRHRDGILRHPDEIPRHPDGIHRRPDDILRHPDEVLRHPDDIRGHPDAFQPHLDDLLYQEDLRRYHDDLRRGEVLLPPDHRRLLDQPYYGPDDPYLRRSPSPPFYAHGRMPPPHLEMRHPGPWPPHRPPHPPHRPPHPRGMPRGPIRPLLQPFHGPEPRLRGKRPPRGAGPGGPMFPQKRPYLPPRF